MRKEIVWVVGIGIFLGLIVAFGVYRINSGFSKNQTAPKASPTPKAVSAELKITLDKPENNDVVTDSSVTVSGITKPLTWVTVSGEKGDYIVQTDESGVFSQDVDLIAGVNQIKLSAFDSAGNENAQKVLVVYSSSFQPAVVISTPNPDESTTGSSEIRQKVAQKIEAAMNRPKAYIGTVTDITDSTIQIKTTDSQIEQISVASDSISVVKATGTTNKTVKLADIAIGDFIVAMGYVNSNSVLNAQRVLITDPVIEPKINPSIGNVTDTSKKGLTVTGLKDTQPVTVTPDKNTEIDSFSNGKSVSLKLGSISDGDTVIYITDTSGTSPIIRSIFVVAKTQS